MPKTAADSKSIETYAQLNAALDGEVVVDIGQVGPLSRKVLKQAMRAGMLVSWRGKWFPIAGAQYGIGPLKTCWGTPEVYAAIRAMDEGIRQPAA